MKAVQNLLQSPVLLVAVALAVLALTLRALGTFGGVGAPAVGPTAAKALLDSGRITLIDVREPREFAAGHIRGARNVPLGKVTADPAGALGKVEGEVLVYCRSGMRSSRAASALAGAGVDVKNLSGGIMAWESAGLSTTR